MNLRHTQVWKDLNFVFAYFPLFCLQHVVENRHRLIRGAYCDSAGNGCLFYLLSEKLPEPFRITSKSELTQFFVGASGYPACEARVYQPARWIVRIIDERVCRNVAKRYPGVNSLPWETVIECLHEHIAARQDGERSEAATRRAVLQRLASSSRLART